jgi:TIR domain
MADTNNVFLSWSGERSKRAADALREWLGTVLQNARPWMSETDIEKGSRGLEEIARALEGMKVGIICLTPENLSADWILYEAGALSKTLDAKTRVCTYLLAGLESRNLKPPLGLFQWTKADKSDTRKLIHTINKHLDSTPVQESRLDTLFDKMWPDIEQKLAALPEPSQAPPPLRGTQEMVAEILELSRVMAPEILEIKDEIDKARRRTFLGDALNAARIDTTGVNAFTTLASLAGGGIGSAFGSASDAVPERPGAPPSSKNSTEPTKLPPVPTRPRGADKK